MQVLTLSGFDNVSVRPIGSKEGRKRRKAERKETKAVKKEKKAEKKAEKKEFKAKPKSERKEIKKEKKVEKKAAKKERKAEKKAAKKEEKKENKGRKTGDKIVHAAAKVTLFENRKAMLTLIKFNFRGYATRLAAMIAKNPGPVKNLWYKYGGSFAALNDMVKQGVKNSPIFIQEKKLERKVADINSGKVSAPKGGVGCPQYIGLTGAEEATISIAGAIVAAAPILIAVTDLFKKEKADVPADAQGLPSIKQMAIDAGGVDPELVNEQVLKQGESPDGSAGGKGLMLAAGLAAAAFLL